MLDSALAFLKDELNTYLLAQTGSSMVEVKLSRLVDESGKYAVEEDSLCATVINIEEERVFKEQIPEQTYVNGQYRTFAPELKLNLHLLFAAHFKLYDQALKFIAYVLTYFQSHTSFTSEIYSTLDARIGKLTLELCSLNYEQLNQVWAFIGGKQLPSVIYKVRLIVLQDDGPTAVQPPLTIIGTNLHYA